MLELLIEATSCSTPQNRRRALLATAHQHDALHDVVVLIEAGDDEPRLLADGHGGDILDQHRIAARFATTMVLARSSDGTDQAGRRAPRRMRADVDGIAADIDVGVADGLQQFVAASGRRRSAC